MTYNKKPSHKKLYLAIALIIILIVASGAAVYFATLPKPITVGVKVGDTFTYNIQGLSVLGVNVTNPDPDFARYNNTQYYKITVVNVQNTTVTLTAEWKFKNGTVVNDDQKIDVASGEKTNDYGFWAIYPANLTVGELLRPTGFDGKTVNATDTKTYTGGTRQTDFFSVEGEFTDITDQTHGTYRYEYTGVNFDQQTGMMVSMQNWQEYNNPQYRLVVLYTLINTNAWDF